eukprot:jgi/Chrzof1/3981/Cz13g15250.t1
MAAVHTSVQHPFRCHLNRPAHSELHHRRSSSVSSLPSTGSTSNSTSRLSDGFALTLERSIGVRQGVDAALISTGVFDAEVYPDLPVASSWMGLLKTLTQHHNDAATTARKQRLTEAGRALRVETIGAQMRSRSQLHKLLCAACGRTLEGGPLHEVTNVITGSSVAVPPPADALLLVSGSHPVRHLPVINKCVIWGDA